MSWYLINTVLKVLDVAMAERITHHTVAESLTNEKAAAASIRAGVNVWRDSEPSCVLLSNVRHLCFKGCRESHEDDPWTRCQAEVSPEEMYCTF